MVATNEWGSSTSEDSTFTFSPDTSCPNTTVRQLTGAAYLPDCRAYELVSPGDTGGAALSPEGPTSPYAENHFAFTGYVNAIPGTGEPINSLFSGDLYVATRSTSKGWTTRYVGLAGSQASATGGIADQSNGTGGIFSTEALSSFLSYDHGNDINIGRAGDYGAYMWSSDGSFIRRLPTNLSEVPGAELDITEGSKFFGDAHPTPDFKHYVFSSRELPFAPGGLAEAPGSVYDNNVEDETETIASVTPAGAEIPQDTAGNPLGSSEYIKIPDVSSDGSHILMSTLAGSTTTVHLYMRVDDAFSYNVSEGRDSLNEPDGINHGVTFQAMTPDGSTVYFTTPLQLTPDDTDTSVDLYRWSDETLPPTLTRVSTGANGAGRHRQLQYDVDGTVQCRSNSRQSMPPTAHRSCGRTGECHRQRPGLRIRRHLFLLARAAGRDAWGSEPEKPVHVSKRGRSIRRSIVPVAGRYEDQRDPGR